MIATALQAPNLAMNPTEVPATTSMFEPVADDILQVERILIDTLAGYRSPIAPLVEHLKHYRGKRLRPALLLLTAKACGGVQPEHLTLAAAVEMIHTATLVHDDVLDEAELRRHVRTVNAEWGNKISILLGDMLFTHAFHLTSRVDQQACAWIGEATNRVCAGELRQVRERGNLHITEDDYYEMVDGKTAALTELVGSLRRCLRRSRFHDHRSVGRVRSQPRHRVSDRRRPPRSHRRRNDHRQNPGHRP